MLSHAECRWAAALYVDINFVAGWAIVDQAEVQLCETIV